MSRDSWFFLFSALCFPIGIIGIIVQIVLRKPARTISSSSRRGRQTAATTTSGIFVSKWQIGIILAFVFVSSVLGFVGFYFSYGDQLRKELRTDNIETTIGQWLSSLNFKTVSIPNSDSYFVFLSSTGPNNPFYVGRTKEHDREKFIVVAGAVTLSPEDQRKVDSLPPEKLNRLQRDIRTELDRLGGFYSLSRLMAQDAISFQTFLLIDNSLTESSLLDAIHKTAAEEDIVVNTIRRDLE